MGKYKIADLVVEFTPLYEYTKELLVPYIYNGTESPVFKVFVSKEEIEAENKRNPHLEASMVEHILLCTRFFCYLIHFDGMVIHSSGIQYKGNAYLFSAPSKTGKSTHTRLWQEVFGEDKVTIFNDDKPAVRFIDGKIFAYGTPFSGGTDINVNVKLPLKAIVFLERSKSNSIRKISPKEALPKLLNETIRGVPENMMNLVFDLVEKIFDKTEIYLLKCNTEKESVNVAYNMIIKDEKNEG
ncbi:MAG: hypothetical protein ACI4QE_05095 [Acutalibacteraceae bacterium]